MAPVRPPRARPVGAILALVVLVIGALFIGGLRGSRQELPYSRFLGLVNAGRVEKVDIGTREVTGVYRDGGRTVSFSATRPPDLSETSLVRDLQAHRVQFTGDQPSALGGLLGSLLLFLVLPIALLVAAGLFIARRVAGGSGASAISLGRSRHRTYDRTDLRTTFSDVAGVEEAVEELREVVDFLEHPARYRRLGGRIPKGVLLVGPPGTGKTLLARAVAGEADVPFFYLSGSDFVELFVGLGAARVRDLFEQAKARAPCIVFIDELDTVGRSRAGAVPTPAGGHDEREQTLNQLLTEMDGFDPATAVILMAATNRPEVLDPALLRPGRFDRQVVVDLPDRRGREAILRIHARSVALDGRVDLRLLAARTPGFAGAELANVVNEAALLAARRGRDVVATTDLEEAIDRVAVGLARHSRVLGERERRRVAYHELGHALVALDLPDADPVHRVSIVPRGVAALGQTHQLPPEDRYLVTRSQLEDRLCVLMGGRAAERLVFGEVSSGGQSDLTQASELARRMVEELGMSDRLGPIALRHPGAIAGYDVPELHSAGLLGRAENEVIGALKAAETRADELLAARRVELDHLADLLLERETLEGDDLRAALGRRERILRAATANGSSPA
ncbi:MAG TPA: ATP-dependent zinc metalloprotease FtsH [Thermoleophilaceae bacterium]